MSAQVLSEQDLRVIVHALRGAAIQLRWNPIKVYAGLKTPLPTADVRDNLAVESLRLADRIERRNQALVVSVDAGDLKIILAALRICILSSKVAPFVVDCEALGAKLEKAHISN